MEKNSKACSCTCTSYIIKGMEATETKAKQDEEQQETAKMEKKMARTEMEVGADGVAVITIINPPINCLSFDGDSSSSVYYHFLFFSEFITDVFEKATPFLLVSAITI